MVFLGVLCAVSTSLMPYFSFGSNGSLSIFLFLVILMIQALFQSMFDIGGNVLLVQAWGPT